MRQNVSIDTINIRKLRSLLEVHRDLLESIGQFAQLRVVIDANFVISELLQRIRYPTRKMTALQELVRASVLEVYAPRWLEKDLTSAIRQIATKGRISEAELFLAWRDYQSLIKWDDTWSDPPEASQAADDPKDLPYVLLEKLVRASGVLSNDRDIERMGGNRLALDFVLTTRSYARSAVVSVGIRVSGRLIGIVAIESLVRIGGVLKSRLEGLSPRWKFVLLGVAVLVLLHPKLRAWLTERLSKLAPAAGVVFDFVFKLVALEAQKREEAKADLARVHAAIRQSRTTGDSD